MVDHLSFYHILEIYVFLLANPFDIKTKRLSISVFTPSFFKKGFLHCRVSPKTDKYTLFGFNSCLFLPKSKVGYVFKWLFNNFTFRNFRNLLRNLFCLLFVLSFFLRLLIWSRCSRSVFDLRKLKFFKVNLRSSSFISSFSGVRNFSFWYFWLVLTWLFRNFYKLWRNYWICFH